MDTGAHVIQELACSECDAELGWLVVRACEVPEKWKEGNYILELEALASVPSRSPTPVSPPRRIPSGGSPARLSVERPQGPRSLTPSLRERSPYRAPLPSMLLNVGSA